MQTVTVPITMVEGRQTITLPASLSIDDDMVVLKKEGDVLHVIPYHNPWQSLIGSLDKFTPDFMEDREQPENQEREAFD